MRFKMENKNTQYNNRITLNGLYFFRVDTVASGKKIQVYKINDFDKYVELSSKGMTNLTKDELIQLKQILANNEEVFLTEGNYLVNSSTVYWEFSINEQGNLSGASYFKDIDEGMKYELTFKDGIAITGNLFKDETLISKFTIDNNILCIRYFDESNVLVSQTEVYLDLVDQENIVCTSFYDNGNKMRVENSMEQTIVSYFSNGAIESEQNLIGQWSKFYEESGLISSEMHCEGDRKTVVSYFNGIITDKMILSDEQNMYYHFKDGKLSNYEVCNNATEEVVCYANDGRIIEKNEALVSAF